MQHCSGSPYGAHSVHCGHSLHRTDMVTGDCADHYTMINPPLFFHDEPLSEDDFTITRMKSEIPIIILNLFPYS